MLSNYFRFVRFPVTCFNKEQILNELAEYDLTIKTTPAGRHWRNWGHRTHIITPEFHEMLSRIGCEVLEAEVFYTAPYSALPWHIDMNPPADNAKLNFVWGNTDHKMNFGEVRDFTALHETSTTKAGSQYVEFAPHQISPKISVCLNQPTLINSGKPHNIVNWSPDGRWCLSVIITQRGSRILFNDAVTLFSEYVLD